MNNLDQQLITKALHGDDDAFSVLVETYQNPVYNLCYRMLGENTAAEDAAQETFWRAYQNLKFYDPQRSFATWLLSIAAHHCIDLQRKHRLQIFEIDEYPDFDIQDSSTPLPESEVIAGDENRELHALIQGLNPPDRAAVILKYWYGCSEEEISEILSLTVSAVKSRLHRARRQLADAITTQEKVQVKGGLRHESPAL